MAGLGQHVLMGQDCGSLPPSLPSYIVAESVALKYLAVSKTKLEKRHKDQSNCKMGDYSLLILGRQSERKEPVRSSRTRIFKYEHKTTYSNYFTRTFNKCFPCSCCAPWSSPMGIRENLTALCKCSSCLPCFNCNLYLLGWRMASLSYQA